VVILDGAGKGGAMVPYDHSNPSQTSRPRLPPELERQLQLCEGIVERMRVLQEQVDWELRQRPSAAPSLQSPYEAAPAIRLAVTSVLRWVAEALGPRRG
jgi:hypothetical protein